MFGFLVLNKPQGITSRKAIDAVKKVVRPAKVGHSGTLDPLASGVLVVGIGPATRLTRFVQAFPKTYVADFRFGLKSATDDIDSEVETVEDATRFDRETLQLNLKKFIGNIAQVPPAFSAVKIDGKRAYKRARAGENFDIKPKQIVVHSIEILEFEYPDCRLRIRCGSGTYIRSIGRDLGAELNCGAVMTALIRQSVGGFSLDSAVTDDCLDKDSIYRTLINPARLFDQKNQVTFDNDKVAGLTHGKMFSTNEIGGTESCDPLAAVDSSGNLLAVLSRHHSGNYKPEINFVHYHLSR